MRPHVILSIAISMVFATQADAGLITVAAAQSSSADDGSAIVTVDGTGLNDPVADAHTGANIHQLVLEGSSTDADPWVHYDFGSTQSLDSIRFWNYNDGGFGFLQRSIRDLDVYGSTDSAAFGDDDHASWVLLGSFEDLAVHPRSGGGAVVDPYGTNYDLIDSNVQYVRFDIVDTYGFQPAFAEVQFFEVVAVPEPSSLLTVGCLLGLVLTRRRKREELLEVR